MPNQKISGGRSIGGEKQPVIFAEVFDAPINFEPNTATGELIGIDLTQFDSSAFVIAIDIP